MDMLLMLAMQAQPAQNPLLGPGITMVAFILIMYFLIIRPQRKMQADHRALIEGVKRGDEVQMEGGLIGTVVHIAEDRVTIKSGDTRVVVSKTKIARIISGTADAPA
jgi:preprotein translocase subunit YajC